MPELPEVETVRRGLEQGLAGRRIARAAARRRDLRVPLPARLGARLAGRRVERIDRRAKYLLLFLDDGQVLLVHLGMSGRVLLHHGAAPPPGPHDHVLLETEDGTHVYFNDPRRFGLMALTTAEAVGAHPRLAGLGPEPLAESFDAGVLAAGLAGRRTSIKAALNDQRLVAGLGNIYVCESLFRARISPRRQARHVAGRRAAALVDAIKGVLADAIAAGGATLRDHRQTTGSLGYFQHAFAVYDRAGRGCPGCDCEPALSGGVRRIVQAGRSTFYCPRRQR